MSKPASAGAPDLARLPITFDLQAISAEEGVRAGLSVAVLVAAAYLLHAPILLESGLGALLTCLCVAGGLTPHRIPAVLSFAAISFVLIAGFGLLRPLGPALIPLACLCIFAFSLVRVFGETLLQVGNLLNVVLVIALDYRFHSLETALQFATAFSAGSLWALLLTLVVWRLHPNRPSRRAVALVYRALGTLCEDIATLAEQPDALTAWERHARHHRRTVRDTIERARGIVTDRLRAAGTTSHPVSQSLLRLESADQIFRALIALGDILEGSTEPLARPDAADLARQLAAIMRVLAPHVVDDTDHATQALTEAIGHLSATTSSWPQATPMRRFADIITDRLWATLNLTPAPAATTLQPLPDPTPPAWRETLAHALHPSSPSLRHAVRAALISAAGFAITFAWPTSYQHWLTITMVLTLQPYYALTLQRALERIGGTVLGGLLAAVLTLFVHTPLAIAASIFPLSVVAFALRGVNFGLYMAFLTPVIVLLVELGAASQSVDIVVMRAVYTLIGGAIAVLGCILIWPSWEPDRLDQELRATIAQHGRFAAIALSWMRNQASQEMVDAARRACGIASNALEASLNRALLEPTGPGRNRLEAAMAIDAALRRMAGRLAALQRPAQPLDPELLAWQAWLATTAALLDRDAPPELPPRPEDPIEDAYLRESLARIARQVELSAGALRRYAGT